MMIGPYRQYLLMVIIFITIRLILSIPSLSTRDLSILFLANLFFRPFEVFRIQNRSIRFMCSFYAEQWIVLI